MLRPRIIPCLLLQQSVLVKTRRFEDPTYIGDPINAVRIFNEKEVDELIVLDIDATRTGAQPNYELIEQLSTECRMPLAYGGGISTTDQIVDIIGLGVEKVILGSSAIQLPNLITDAATVVGSQSISVVVDVRSDPKLGYQTFTHNGTKATGMTPESLAVRAEANGAGEFIVNNIERDGMMCGYDLDLVSRCRKACSLPITAIGGAGNLDHLTDLRNRFSIIGAAAGSMFVFKGKYRAVLISYLKSDDKELIYGLKGQ